MSGYLKMCIVCRKDLSMPTGKFGAMIAHAAMSFIVNKLQLPAVFAWDTQNYVGLKATPEQGRWLTELDPGLEEQKQKSMAKIVLAVNSEQELLEVEKKAKEANLEVHRVIDSGYAHNKPGTFVCIAIGPDWPEKLDPVTGNLPVYR